MEIQDNNQQHEQLSSENWLLLISKFPELIQLKEGLNDLLQMDKSNMEQQEIGELSYRKALIQTFASIQFSADCINNCTVYRARKNIDENNENISLVKTYPNAAFCKSNLKIAICFQSAKFSRNM